LTGTKRPRTKVAEDRAPWGSCISQKIGKEIAKGPGPSQRVDNKGLKGGIGHERHVLALSKPQGTPKGEHTHIVELLKWPGGGGGREEKRRVNG